MAIQAPQRLEFYGLKWSIRGKPFSRRTRIELVFQGKYARVLNEYPHIWAQAAPDLAQLLRENAPVDTGMLRASIRLEYLGRKPVVSLGPERYNRAALKAAQQGRVYRKRGRGRPKLTGFYALPANARSRRVGYIEGALQLISRDISLAAQQYFDLTRAGVEAGAAQSRLLGTLGLGTARQVRPMSARARP